MESFPRGLTPENTSQFLSRLEFYFKPKMREDIFLFLLSRNSEEDYYALENFYSKFLTLNKPEFQNIVQKVAYDLSEELYELGWKCAFAYGDTGLYIYRETPPAILDMGEMI